MNISELIDRIEIQGVELWTEGEELRFRAPRGVLGQKEKETLRSNRQAVIDYLSGDGQSEPLQPDEENRYKPFPLTDVQTAYFLGRYNEFDYGGLSCRGYLEVEFLASVSVEAINHAWRQLIAHHDMLRAVVEEDGYQRVLEQVADYQIAAVDLRELSDSEAEWGLARLRNELLSEEVDYATWPLFKARVALQPETTLLLIAIELILVDSASLYQLIDELEQLIDDPGRALDPLNITFRDYVLEQRLMRQSRGYRVSRRYWMDRIESMVPAPELPIRGELPLEQEKPLSLPFSRRSFTLNATEKANLNKLAAANGVTETAALLTAYAETLGEWSTTKHFTLNLPIFNRVQCHPQVDSLIGDFTSVTLLDVDLDADDVFAERARRLSKQLFSDLDHRYFSGVEVMAELNRQRGESVLFPYVFTSALGTQSREKTRSKSVIREGLTQTPQVLIDCQVTDFEGGVLVAWDVRDEMFPDGLIDSAFEAFSHLMKQLVWGESAWHAEHPISLPQVQFEVRPKLAVTEAPRMDHFLHTAIVQQAERTPDALAIILPTEDLTYAQLVNRAKHTALALRAMGFTDGQRVGIVLGKGSEQIISVLAILMAGGCYVPIDHDQPQNRRNVIIENAEISYVFAGSDLELPESVTRIEVSQLDQAPDDSLTLVQHKADDPAYVIYTSGSTGEPKGVVISHKAASNTIADINSRFNVSSEDRLLAVANLSFDLSVYDIFGLLRAGGTLVIPSESNKTNPAHWSDMMKAHRVTLWNSVPDQLQMLCDLLNTLDKAERPDSLRLALVSGDWVPLELLEQLQTTCTGAKLISLGGATEASIWSIYHPVTEVKNHWHSIPYGTPLNGQGMYVVDPYLRPRPDWVIGEICISGIGLAQGYLNDPEKTREHFVIRQMDGERLYRTGDLGRFWSDGTIEFLGRIDNQVKILGHRVEAGEIEAAMRVHSLVNDGVVLAVDDGNKRKTLVGFAELAMAAGVHKHHVIEEAKLEAERIEAQLDGETFSALMKAADYVAMLAMAGRLRADGLFFTDAEHHSLQDIYQATGVIAEHQRLLRRWLDGLLSAGALRVDEDGNYLGLTRSDADRVEVAWAEAENLEKRAGYGTQTLHYVRVCSAQLSELLRGEVDVRQILFPQGEMGTARAAYRDNLVSQGMNRIVTTAISSLAKQQSESSGLPLRVLEVGAGVAGTASDLVPALAEYQPEYWFTDLSEFFLSEARKQFAGYPWMKYGIFDMNKDARGQGFVPNAFDVILCANVLHNARNADQVIGQFRQLLAPGGTLVFIEPTRRHNYPLLVSMEFFPELTGFTDLRAETDQTFFTRAQWLEILNRAGATEAECAPRADSALNDSGQGVFVAHFNTDRAPLRIMELVEHLQARLPGYMVPAQLQLVNQLPRLKNGKIDRKTLTHWALQSEQIEASSAGAQPVDDLERRIGAVWAEVLDLSSVARDVDFYSMGGDSLLLSRMVGRLRSSIEEASGLEWETLLRYVLRQPTIAALGQLLREAASNEQSAEQESASIVPLWGDALQCDNLFVLVHAVTGNLLPYQNLIGVLPKQYWSRGVGIELPSDEAFLSLNPTTAINELASRYSSELAGCGQRFTLIGYCLGGLLAAEIAGNLIEQGKEVTELVVISAYQPPAIADELLVDYIFARAMGVDLQQLQLPTESQLGEALQEILSVTPEQIPADAFINLSEAHRSVQAAFESFGKLSADERLSAIYQAAQPKGLYNTGSLQGEEFDRSYALFRQSIQAVGCHQPNAYLGKTVLLRNSNSETLLPGTRNDVADYWRNICLGELIIDDVPGDHFSCLSSQNSVAIAALIQRYLGREEVS